MPKYACLLYFICLLASCKNDNLNRSVYAEQRANLARQEKEKPLTFLSVEATYRKNLTGQTVISGTVTNIATVNSYKEVRVKTLCYNEEKKILEEHEDLIGGVIKPNMARKFKLRYYLPRGTDSLAVSLMSAATVEK